jgi:hypothetical protein
MTKLVIEKRQSGGNISGSHFRSNDKNKSSVRSHFSVRQKLKQKSFFLFRGTIKLSRLDFGIIE